MKRVSYFLPAIFWAIAILWLSLLPGNDLPKWWFFEAIFIDKWVHITMYLLLSLMLLIAGGIRGRLSGPLQWILVGLVAAYGILIEILQEALTTTRHFEWGDIAADTIGAMLGVLLIRYLWKKKMFLPKA